MATFLAKYNGRCAAGDAIEVGEEVTYLDDDLMHSNCARDVARNEAQSEQWVGSDDESMGF